MKKILLTGANGFLGSHILKLLVKEGYSPVILIRATSDLWRIDDVLDKCDVFVINEAEQNLKNVFEVYDIYGVIHTATEYGRDQPLSLLLRTNVIFPIELIELGIRSNIKVFINTDTFFAKPQFKQTYLNNYTESKRILEKYLVQLSKDILVCNLRLEHVFGENDSSQKFVTAIINDLINNEKEILLTEGIQKRDFIYIEDAANAFMHVLKFADDKKGFKEFQVGTGQSISVREFVEEVARITRSQAKLVLGALPTREGDIKDSFANIESLMVLGWKPKFDLKQAIANLLLQDKNLNNEHRF